MISSECNKSYKMKTPKTFLAEAPKIEPMDWKDAFKMLYFSIETEARTSRKIKCKTKLYDEVKGLKDEAQSVWDEMDEDEQEEWMIGKFILSCTGYLSGCNSVKMKSAVGEFVC